MGQAGGAQVVGIVEGPPALRLVRAAWRRELQYP